eukprot:3310298-Pyramimonas_sp.AAC.1
MSARGLWLPAMQRVARAKGGGHQHPFFQLLSGSAPAGASLAEWGYSVSDRCQFCGERDTMWHRCWTCTHRPVAAVKNQHFCHEL